MTNTQSGMILLKNYNTVEVFRSLNLLVQSYNHWACCTELWQLWGSGFRKRGNQRSQSAFQMCSHFKSHPLTSIRTLKGALRDEVEIGTSKYYVGLARLASKPINMRCQAVGVEPIWGAFFQLQPNNSSENSSASGWDFWDVFLTTIELIVFTQCKMRIRSLVNPHLTVFFMFTSVVFNLFEIDTKQMLPIIVAVHTDLKALKKDSLKRKTTRQLSANLFLFLFCPLQ